jgi:6-pyruvoyltetrahydropterin/6-carboxytetrahydropterin synthase
MIWSCTRKLEFDYGHRLINHESKCAHAHGHRGVVELECVADALDIAGRVIDFGVIKEIVGGWIDEKWDHAFLVNEDDRVMCEFLVEQQQRRYFLPCEPSAENLAQYLLTKANELLKGAGVVVKEVRFWETPNGSSTATLLPVPRVRE